MYIHHILLTILSCLFKCTELQSWRFYEEFLVHLLSCCPNKKIFNTVHMDIQEVRQSCFKFCKACCTPPTHILTSTLVFHFTNKHWIDTKAKQNWPCFKIFVGNFSNLEIWKLEIQLVDFKLQNTQQEVVLQHTVNMVLWNKELLMADCCWPKCSNSLNPVGHILTFSFFFSLIVTRT